MSQQEARAAKARLETCQHCKRFQQWDETFGRCGKYTQYLYFCRTIDTCDNFKERTSKAGPTVFEQIVKEVEAHND